MQNLIKLMDEINISGAFSANGTLPSTPPGLKDDDDFDVDESGFVDLDLQSNLTSFFLCEEQLEELWQDNLEPNTIYRCIQPLIKGTSDILAPQLQEIELEGASVALLAGDLSLSQFEGELATVWPECADGRKWAFRRVE